MQLLKAKKTMTMPIKKQAIVPVRQKPTDQVSRLFQFIHYLPTKEKKGEWKAREGKKREEKKEAIQAQ